MLKKLFLTILILFALSSFSFAASSQETDMLTVLDLWRAGNFGDLYDKLIKTKKTKEEFISIMKDSTVKPACCEKRIQYFEIVKEKNNFSRVYARIGVEGAGVDTVSIGFTLRKVDGKWLMYLRDVVKIANISKQKKGKKESKSLAK